MAKIDLAPRPVDRRNKGLPEIGDGVLLSQIGEFGWNILREEVPLPVCVLRSDALSNNSAWMTSFLERSGAKIAPHGKTTMCPALFAQQIEDGAWAITVATGQQLRVARQAGVSRVIFANILIDPHDIAYVLEELRRDPLFDFYCLVDSIEGVSRLARAAERAQVGRPLNVLLEVGYFGGRTGCRTIETALEVACGVHTAFPALALCGVEGFEGLHQNLPAQDAEPKVVEFLTRMADTARQISAENLFDSDEVILTAGGSSYYDKVVDILGNIKALEHSTVVLRSGCYLTHDIGIYDRNFDALQHRSKYAAQISGRMENALEVWARVLSVPEVNRAIVGAGRRDFGHDDSPPVAIKLFRPQTDVAPSRISAASAVVAINDQHAHLEFSSELDLRVGDMIALGVSHPCTTFDKWRLIYMVDQDYTIKAALETFF